MHTSLEWLLRTSNVQQRRVRGFYATRRTYGTRLYKTQQRCYEKNIDLRFTLGQSLKFATGLSVQVVRHEDPVNFFKEKVL